VTVYNVLYSDRMISGYPAGSGLRRVRLILLLSAGLVAAGCGSSTQPPTAAQSAPVPAQSATAQPDASSGTPATGKSAGRHRAGRQDGLRVLTEPAAGIGPVYRLLTGARSSVDLTMYELSDPTAEADLTADAARGVDVRVLLDQHLERDANTAAYNFLTAHGVHVRWAPAGTTYHQKTLTVDNRTSVVMTLNLVAEYYAGTRDFAVIDTRHADVAAIVATFNADFATRFITPPDGADLVWSPTNANASVLSVIGGATRSLAVEDEEMDDPAVTSALAAAARRGVDVRVVMTANPEWDAAFAELAAAGVHIRLYADDSSELYIHAKAIVADAGRRDQEVLVGSQNFSVASLGYNRELGIRTSDPTVVRAISATLAADYAGATAYRSSKGANSGSGSAGAWCTATASVYNAAEDENNVYVHSNQPYKDATATADGYSHSYEANGSGYALIYLNGPPPGARITVTIGSATCTTSD
jgi:cardiolipin synthase A/B